MPYLCDAMANNYRYADGAEYPHQYKYEHMAVTTDCVIFCYEDRTLKVLLVRRGLDPFKGEWALPGGFLRMNETAKDGALRELWEETSLNVSAIRELGVFSDIHRDPRERVITIAYYALVKPSQVEGGDDAEDADWFPIIRLPVLAFDHQRIIHAALERIRKDIHFEPIGFDLLDDTFTIPDLQRLYEIILGTQFDRRNFQRKIISSGILEEVPAASHISESRADIPRMKYHPMSSLFDSPIREQRVMCCEQAAPNRDYLSERFKDTDILMSSVAPKPESKEKKRPGRTASLFRLNKKKYEEMKEEGDKFEF